MPTVGPWQANSQLRPPSEWGTDLFRDVNADIGITTVWAGVSAGRWVVLANVVAGLTSEGCDGRPIALTDSAHLLSALSKRGSSIKSCKTAAPTAPATPTPPSFWLTPFRDEFLRSLARLGYARRTIKTFRRMVDRLCGEVEARGFEPETLDVNAMRDPAAACPRSGTPYMERDLAMAT